MESPTHAAPTTPSAPAADPIAGSELAAFVACAQAGSVHGAADALDLTQSAVTKRMQRLERRLGVQLLARSAQGVALTGAGEAVLPAARAALEALAGVGEAVTAHAGTASRALPIAASHTVGDYLLTGWLAEFGRAHPGVRATIEVVNSPGVLDALRAGRAAVGFVEGVDPAADMTRLQVASDEITIAVAPTHRWRGRTSIAPAELRDEPYVSRESGSGTRAVADAALARVGIALDPSLQVDSTEAVKRALQAGGFTLLSSLATAAEIEAGTLLALPVRGVPIHRELWACHVTAVRLEGAAAELWHWLERS